MDAEMASALEDSITHWKRMREKPWTEKPRGEWCALCSLVERASGCQSCPVTKRTGEWQCADTPFYIAVEAWHALQEHEDSIATLVWCGLAWRIAAQNEIEFLESLREEPKCGCGTCGNDVTQMPPECEGENPCTECEDASKWIPRTTLNDSNEPEDAEWLRGRDERAGR